MRREGLAFLGFVLAIGSCTTTSGNGPCLPDESCSGEGFQCLEVSSECWPCVCTKGKFVCTQKSCTPDSGKQLPKPTVSWWPAPMWLVAGESTTIDVSVSNVPFGATATVALIGVVGKTAPAVAVQGLSGFVASVPLDLPASVPLGHVVGTVIASFSPVPAGGPASVSAPFDVFVTGTPGSFDPTFGEHGCLQLEVSPRGVRALADGTVVIAGDGGLGAFVARLLPNGAYDETFGDHGAFTLANASMVSFDVASDGRIAFSFDELGDAGITSGVAIVDSTGALSKTIATEAGPVACFDATTIVAGKHVVSTIDAQGQLTTGSMPLNLVNEPRRAVFAADGSIVLSTTTCDTQNVCTPSIGKIIGQGAAWVADASFGTSGVATITSSLAPFDLVGTNTGDLFVGLGQSTFGEVTHITSTGVASPTTTLAQAGGPLAFDELASALLAAGGGGSSLVKGAVVSRLSSMTFTSDPSFGYEGVLGLPDETQPVYEAIDASHRLYVAGSTPNVLCRIRLQ